MLRWAVPTHNAFQAFLLEDEDLAVPAAEYPLLQEEEVPTPPVPP